MIALIVNLIYKPFIYCRYLRFLGVKKEPTPKRDRFFNLYEMDAYVVGVPGTKAPTPENEALQVAMLFTSDVRSSEVIIIVPV